MNEMLEKVAAAGSAIQRMVGRIAGGAGKAADKARALPDDIQALLQQYRPRPTLMEQVGRGTVAGLGLGGVAAGGALAASPELQEQARTGLEAAGEATQTGLGEMGRQGGDIYNRFRGGLIDAAQGLPKAAAGNSPMKTMTAVGSVTQAQPASPMTGAAKPVGAPVPGPGGTWNGNSFNSATSTPTAGEFGGMFSKNASSDALQEHVGDSIVGMGEESHVDSEDDAAGAWAMRTGRHVDTYSGQ